MESEKNQESTIEDPEVLKSLLYALLYLWLAVTTVFTAINWEILPVIPKVFVMEGLGLVVGLVVNVLLVFICTSLWVAFCCLAIIGFCTLVHVITIVTWVDEPDQIELTDDEEAQEEA